MLESAINGRVIGSRLLKLFDTFLVDCDGVLWIGESAISGLTIPSSYTV